MKKRIILAAAENGALPGGKIGGVGDVLRDLPVALAGIGWQPIVITPSYGMLHTLPGAHPIGHVDFAFAGDTERASIYRVPGPSPAVEHIVLEHPLLSPQGAGLIYCDDGPDRPFATDASKFAFYSAAVVAYLCKLDEPPDTLHLHDWHTAPVLALRRFDPSAAALRKVHTVFTIHNLAWQGIRPLKDDDSSLASWYPDLNYEKEYLVDPGYPDGFNPMAAAIRLADRVNTVSPTYAREICKPSDPEHGFSGGEGLQNDLQKAFDQNRLTGILNGCEYPDRMRCRPGWQRMLNTMISELAAWGRKTPAMSSLHAATAARLNNFPLRRPPNVLVNIGRLTSQKVDLFLQETSSGSSALDAILESLGSGGVFIMLGSGDRELEQQIANISTRRENFALLCGFSDTLAELLYQAGDLFLMPSSFEPCGISQMLAMRGGQPCVVHAVGGLRDTVRDGEDGFLFSGETPRVQAENFVASVRRAINMKTSDDNGWNKIRTQAATKRFSWERSAEEYVKFLYERPCG